MNCIAMGMIRRSAQQPTTPLTEFGRFMIMCDPLRAMDRAELLRWMAYLRASTPRGIVRSVLDISMGSAAFTSRGMSQLVTLGKTAGLNSIEAAIVFARPRGRLHSAISLFVRFLISVLIAMGILYVLTQTPGSPVYAPGARYASISPRDFERT